jgi:hypothetical protein
VMGEYKTTVMPASEPVTAAECKLLKIATT